MSLFRQHGGRKRRAVEKAYINSARHLSVHVCACTLFPREHTQPKFSPRPKPDSAARGQEVRREPCLLDHGWGPVAPATQPRHINATKHHRDATHQGTARLHPDRRWASSLRRALKNTTVASNDCHAGSCRQAQRRCPTTSQDECPSKRARQECGECWLRRRRERGRGCANGDRPTDKQLGREEDGLGCSRQACRTGQGMQRVSCRNMQLCTKRCRS